MWYNLADGYLRRRSIVPHSRYQRGEIAARDQKMYDRKIREKVEADHRGEFLALDIETGEYGIDVQPRAVLDRAKAKREHSPLFLIRIGHPAAFRLGGTFKVTS